MIKAYSLINGTFALRAKLPVLKDEAAYSWVQIAKQGQWKGHHSGEFELTADTFEEMITNFEAQTNPVPVTYEHPSHSGDGNPIKAAGWILELESRGKDLWACVQWTEPAAKMVRSGEYLYCSMVFGSSKHRETGDDVGTELFELGLTNSPFVDGMEPMRLSRSTRKNLTLPKAERKSLSMKFDIKAIAEALLALPKDAGAEQLHKALEAAVLAQEAQESKPESAPEEAAPPAEMAALSAMPIEAAASPDDAPPADSKPAAEMILGALKDALAGMDDAAILAFVQDNKDALAGLAGAQPDSGTQSAPADSGKAMGRAEIAEAKVTELSRRLESFEKLAADSKANEETLRLSRIDAMVDSAVETGVILKVSRDAFVRLGRLSEAELSTALGELKAHPAVPTGLIVRSVVQSQSAVEPRDEVEKAIIKMNQGQSVRVIEAALSHHRDTRKTDLLNGRV